MRHSRSLLAWACILSIVLAYWPTASANMSSQERGGLLHVLETDKYLYQLPEFVHIGYSVTNVSDAPIPVALAWCGCPIPVSVEDPSEVTVWCRPCGCVDEACIDTLAVGESYSKLVAWDMYVIYTDDLIDQLGVYTVIGRFRTYDPDLEQTMYLDIEIEENPTSVPEDGVPRSWALIKAMCR